MTDCPHGKGYALEEPFDIDDGSLDGMAPEHAFALGVEWARAREALVRNEPVRMTIHTVNWARIQKLARRHERNARMAMFHDDWCEVEF